MNWREQRRGQRSQSCECDYVRNENEHNIPAGKYTFVLVLARRKCCDLEEELKNVTNNLKSLEAQSEKVELSLFNKQTVSQY